MNHVPVFRRRAVAHWSMLGLALFLTAAVPLAVGGLLKFILTALE